MLASGTSSVVRLIRILRRLARQQKSADRNREAPSTRSAGNDVIRTQTTKSAGSKTGAVASNWGCLRQAARDRAPAARLRRGALPAPPAGGHRGRAAAT